MSFSGGVFSVNSAGQPVVSNTVISSTAFNALTADLATGLSTCVLKDGSQTTTASVPFVVGIAVTTAITTPSTTFALVNTTATTVNAFGAATVVNLGLSSGSAISHSRRTAVAVYTAWDPTDVAGTLTNGAATYSATSTAAPYGAWANVTGTSTFTAALAGVYRFSVHMEHQNAASATLTVFRPAVGGTGTILLGSATELGMSSQATVSSSGPFGADAVFYAVLTAAQTVTILPKVAITSAGATADFTTQCTIAAEFTGAG